MTRGVLDVKRKRPRKRCARCGHLDLCHLSVEPFRHVLRCDSNCFGGPPCDRFEKEATNAP